MFYAGSDTLAAVAFVLAVNRASTISGRRRELLYRVGWNYLSSELEREMI